MAIDHEAGGHPLASAEAWLSRFWDERLWLAGNETSQFEPSYLAGAVNADQRDYTALRRGNNDNNRARANGKPASNSQVSGRMTG